jgi:hypothetical protein
MRGQGAVEAIVALPVFLVLVYVLFQVFLLAIVQVQLRYAAFCAARVGAVRDADIKEMETAARKVLSKIPGFFPASTASYRVELLHQLENENLTAKKNTKTTTSYLKIRIHLDYPLALPLLNVLSARISSDRSLKGVPTVPLHASWTTIYFGEISEQSDG